MYKFKHFGDMYAIINYVSVMPFFELAILHAYFNSNISIEVRRRGCATMYWAESGVRMILS